MKVTEGIHTVGGLRVGNACLVRGADGLRLVDSGTPDQALASAATLRSLEPRLLLPGHGAPVRG